MTTNPSYGNIFPEAEWGTTFSQIQDISTTENIFACHVNVSDLKKIASKLTENIMNHSWITSLDDRSRRAYETTAKKTAEELVKVFQANLTNDAVSSEFGELMVSMGSSRALEIVFEHKSIPIAELWKPKLKQNEGFDFHTVCKNDLINFGEAKYSSSQSPYGGNSGETSGAGGQADGFIANKKHLMDNVHLPKLAGETAATNLDNDCFGIILAFSLNTKNPLEVFKNAVEKTQTYENLIVAKSIYIVGVSYDKEN